MPGSPFSPVILTMSVHSFIKKSRALLCLCPLLVPLVAPGQSLLKVHPLEGNVKTTAWTFLASQNPYRIPDSPTTMTGTMAVQSPGYGAGMGLYSWTGNYAITVNQKATAAPSFRIHHVVFQLDATWDPAIPFPFNGGPKLSFNGLNQQLPATLPMIVDGTRVVDNNTGIPEMEGIDSFAYRGITWQWDLSAIAGGVSEVKIQMPFANHTSVVGARIDVASQFAEIGAPETPLQAWRKTHFGTSDNAGNGADAVDHDRDGLSNLVEYALGSSPLSGSGSNGPAIAPKALFVADRLRLSFSIPATPPSDVIYRVRASDDLVDWTTLATKSGTGAWVWNGDGSARITTTTQAGRSLLEVEDDRTAGNSPSRMMKLEVSY